MAAVTSGTALCLTRNVTPPAPNKPITRAPLSIMNVTFKQSLYGDFDGCSAGAFNLWYLNAPTPAGR
jgi:hypothetical protein